MQKNAGEEKRDAKRKEVKKVDERIKGERRILHPERKNEPVTEHPSAYKSMHLIKQEI